MAVILAHSHIQPRIKLFPLQSAFIFCYMVDFLDIEILDRIFIVSLTYIS